MKKFNFFIKLSRAEQYSGEIPTVKFENYIVDLNRKDFYVNNCGWLLPNEPTEN